MEKQYILLVLNEAIKMQKSVNDLMKDNWIPLGGISVTTAINENGNSEYRFAQALVRQKD